jgi:hypothetical protein
MQTRLPFRLRRLKDRPAGEYYVGLDLHSRGSVFEVETPTGRPRAEGEVRTTPPAGENIQNPLT